jgi:hypothetical protein
MNTMTFISKCAFTLDLSFIAAITENQSYDDIKRNIAKCNVETWNSLKPGVSTVCYRCQVLLCSPWSSKQSGMPFEFTTAPHGALATVRTFENKPPQNICSLFLYSLSSLPASFFSHPLTLSLPSFPCFQ